METDFYKRLILNYIIYYKNKNDVEILNIFENIDPKNILSTNKFIENFYSDVAIFNKNDKENSDINKVYDKPDFKVGEIYYKLLIDNVEKYYSLSLIALLIEQTNLQYEHKDLKFHIEKN